MTQKSKPKVYIFNDFAKTKDKATEYFLHYAHDHLLASSVLQNNPCFFDSSAYLLSIAFELLLKGLHIAEFGRFCKGHDLVMLNKALPSSVVHDSENEIFNILNTYSHVRYPIAKDLYKKHGTIKVGDLKVSLGDIGTIELEGAIQLFNRIWTELSYSTDFQKIIYNINANPNSKGGRILMSKNSDNN